MVLYCILYASHGKLECFDIRLINKLAASIVVRVEFSFAQYLFISFIRLSAALSRYSPFVCTNKYWVQAMQPNLSEIDELWINVFLFCLELPYQDCLIQIDKHNWANKPIRTSHFIGACMHTQRLCALCVNNPGNRLLGDIFHFVRQKCRPHEKLL